MLCTMRLGGKSTPPTAPLFAKQPLASKLPVSVKHIRVPFGVLVTAAFFSKYVTLPLPRDKWNCLASTFFFPPPGEAHFHEDRFADGELAPQLPCNEPRPAAKACWRSWARRGASAADLSEPDFSGVLPARRSRRPFALPASGLGGPLSAPALRRLDSSWSLRACPADRCLRLPLPFTMLSSIYICILRCYLYLPLRTFPGYYTKQHNYMGADFFSRRTTTSTTAT